MAALSPPPLSPTKQIVAITLCAVAIFFLVRRLPTGTNLNHIDFRVSGKNVIEFCDPANPQFLPVVQVKSPVSMALTFKGSAPAMGSEKQFTLILRTANGKAIGPEDLILTHTQLLHLLIVDPLLDDYQHVHPVPTKTPGEWSFSLTPRASGTYRVFADFTPVATGRGLYASTDLEISQPATIPSSDILTPAEDSWTQSSDGYLFELHPGKLPVHARQQIALTFEVSKLDEGMVDLKPVMGAYAHLVAFDSGRTGFAHLHPDQADLSQKLDSRKPLLTFKITIPNPGRYVIWAQVNLGNGERFVPFRLRVE